MTFIQAITSLAKEIHFNHLSDTTTIKVHITKVNEFQKVAEEHEVLDEISEDMDKQGNWYFFRGRTGLIF